MASGIARKGWRKGQPWTVKRGKRVYHEDSYHPRDRLVIEMGFKKIGDEYLHSTMPLTVIQRQDGMYVLKDSDSGHVYIEDDVEERFVDRVEGFMAPLRP